MHVSKEKIEILDQYLTSSCVADVWQPSAIHISVPDRGKLVMLVAGKRRRLLFTGDDNEVSTRRILNIMQRQQNSI